MAHTHRLTIDPSTDVVSWKLLASFGGDDYELVIVRSTDVISWTTINEAIVIGSGLSVLGIDSATDVVSWENVN